MDLRAWLASATFAGNDLTTWAMALNALIATAAAVLLLKRVVPRWAAAWATRTSTGLDDLAADVLSRTHAFFAIAVGLLSALAILTLPPATEDVVRRIVVALGVVQGGLWSMGVVQYGLERYVQRADPLVGNATGVLRALSMVAVWALVLLLLLANLGVDVTAGIAGLGVGGIAVALAMQNILGDLFASFSIVFDRPFGIGDFVVVGDHSGTIEHIGVAYGTHPATLREIPAMLRSAVTAVPGVRFDRGHFFRFGESSLDYEVVWYVLDGDYTRYMDAQQAIYLDILDRLTAVGVEIPFPQRTLWLQQPLRAAAPAVSRGEGERVVEAVG